MAKKTPNRAVNNEYFICIDPEAESSGVGHTLDLAYASYQEQANNNGESLIPPSECDFYKGCKIGIKIGIVEEVK